MKHLDKGIKGGLSLTMGLCALLLLASACGKSAEDKNNDEASGLYQRTCSLTRSYIDSIRNAPDTTHLNQLIERFEAGIDNLNFNVNPDTDYDLTEGENDTIYMLLTQLSEARAERLKALGVNPAEVDSLNIVSPVKDSI